MSFRLTLSFRWTHHLPPFGQVKQVLRDIIRALTAWETEKRKWEDATKPINKHMQQTLWVYHSLILHNVTTNLDQVGQKQNVLGVHHTTLRQPWLISKEPKEHSVYTNIQPESSNLHEP